MSRPVIMPGEAKLIVGVDSQIVRFYPAVPISGTPTYGANYQGTALVAAGTAATAFGASLLVASIAADRQTLTLSGAAAGVVGLAGDRGGVVGQLLGAAYGELPVKVMDISGTSVRLADRIPEPITIASGVDALELRGWYATLTNAAVTSVARRNVRVLWSYTAALGTNYANEPHQHVLLVHVVPIPFAIDLHQEALFDLAPSFARWIPARQQSWMPQILRAERRIVTWLRQAGYVEDRLYGGDFAETCAHLACAYILAGRAAVGAGLREEADAFEAKAKELFERVMANLQVYDSDDDGIYDDGEANVDLLGPRANMAGGFMDGDDTDFDEDVVTIFKRDQQH